MRTEHTPAPRAMSMYDAVMLAEMGDIDDPEVLAAWQYLVDTGTVWTLQGFFGRTAQRLISAGLISS